VIFIAGHWISVEHKSPESLPTQISLIDAVPEPVRREPPPKAEQPLQTKPVVRQVQQTIAAAPTPIPQPSPVEIPNLPTSPVARTIPAVVPEALHSNSAAEGRFAQEVRSRIEQKKVYPAVARDLGMVGTVEVAYVLDRAGQVLKADVIASSGYPMLDQAALAAVRNASFRAMPEDAWVGDKQKEFRTKLVFSINY
jgi:protein TonB